MGSALFRNLRFLQKALCFLGIPRTLALAQVSAAISTVPQWAMVEMAAPTWARARMGTEEMAAPTWARARAGPHPACACARTFKSALRFLGIPRKHRFLKSAEHIHQILSSYISYTP